MAQIESVDTPNEEFKKQLHIVKDDIDNLLKAAGENTTHNATECAKELGMHLRGWTEKHYEQASEVRSKIEDKLRVHPITATASAFAAGMLTTMLFRRR